MQRCALQGAIIGAKAIDPRLIRFVQHYSGQTSYKTTLALLAKLHAAGEFYTATWGGFVRIHQYRSDLLFRRKEI